MAAAFTLALITPAPAKAYGEELVMSWQFYRRLAQCETGSNVNHSTRSYTGMFGIYRRTWQAYSNHSSARGMTALQQARVVDNIAFNGHTERGRFQHPVGLWGWGAIKQNCMQLQSYICKSRHPLVQKQKRECQ